jgi:hypothetical protein
VIDRDEHGAVNQFQAVRFPAPVPTRVIPCGVRLISPQLTTFDDVEEASSVFSFSLAVAR